MLFQSTLPPLRERGDDVIEIAHALLALMSLEEGKNFSRFDNQVTNFFNQYQWPGNVRELQNVIRNIVVLNDNDEVTIDMLPPQLKQRNGAEIASTPSEPAVSKPTVSQSVTPSSMGGDERQAIEPLWIVEKTGDSGCY